MPDIATELELRGSEDLATQLDRLGKGLSGPIVKDALKASAAIMQAAAVALVRQRTGLLVRSLKLKPKSNGPGKYAMLVSATTTKALAAKGRKSASAVANYNVFYGSFVEFGHRQGKRPKAVGYQRISGIDVRGRKYSRKRAVLAADARGSVPAHPFLRPAFDANEQRALDTIERDIQRAIDALTR